MNPTSYEALMRNPEVLQALLQQARRERAAAVHRYLIRPIARLFAPLEWRGVSGRPSPG